MAREKPFTNWDSVPVLFGSDICAIILGMPINTIQKKAKSGVIPAHKIGKNYRYEKNEIKEWLLAH